MLISHINNEVLAKHLLVGFWNITCRSSYSENSALYLLLLKNVLFEFNGFPFPITVTYHVDNPFPYEVIGHKVRYVDINNIVSETRPMNPTEGSWVEVDKERGKWRDDVKRLLPKSLS